MTIRVGSIIKEKVYSGLTEYENEYGEVTEISLDKSFCVIKWHVKNPKYSNISTDNLKGISTKYINVVCDDLKVGNIVLTNGDGSKKYHDWILGEIGEIIADEDGRKVIYLWNDVANGSKGTRTVRRWKRSWLIYGDNKLAKMIIVNNKVDDGTEKCEKCNEVFKEDELHIGADNNYYCDSCWEQNFYTCEDCGTTIWQDDSHCTVNGEVYCEDCYDSHYCHCNNCSDEISNDDAKLGADNNYYCEDCWEERFNVCDDCGSIQWSENLEYNEETNEYFCSTCLRNKRKKVIHDYGYRPEAVFKKMEYDQSLYMGIELEIQRKSDYIDYADKFMTFLKEEGTDEHFYLKHDGSVSNGFEIVSHPVTLKYAHKNIGFQKILTWLQENEFTSEQSGECGLHVHISKNFFEDLDITKMRLFFKQNQDKLFKFSRRSQESLHFCDFEKKSIKDILDGEISDGRYWALNLNSSRETIEIRMFRGTLDVKRFVSILQFVDAFSHFVKDVGITSLIIGEREYKENSWKLFIDWCKEENKYTTMLKYLEGEKLCV